MPQLARSTLQMFLQLKQAAHLTKQTAIVPFVIYTSENVLESNAVDAANRHGRKHAR
jgi:hypothetical protein